LRSGPPVHALLRACAAMQNALAVQMQASSAIISLAYQTTFFLCRFPRPPICLPDNSDLLAAPPRKQTRQRVRLPQLLWKDQQSSQLMKMTGIVFEDSPNYLACAVVQNRTNATLSVYASYCASNNVFSVLSLPVDHNNGAVAFGFKTAVQHSNLGLAKQLLDADVRYVQHAFRQARVQYLAYSSEEDGKRVRAARTTVLGSQGINGSPNPAPFYNQPFTLLLRHSMRSLKWSSTTPTICTLRAARTLQMTKSLYGTSTLGVIPGWTTPSVNGLQLRELTCKASWPEH
jgi:hypothetical protein